MGSIIQEQYRSYASYLEKRVLPPIIKMRDSEERTNIEVEYLQESIKAISELVVVARNYARQSIVEGRVDEFKIFPQLKY